MFYFTQGGTVVPCSTLFALVTLSFGISGHDLLLAGTLMYFIYKGLVVFNTPCTYLSVL